MKQKKIGNGWLLRLEKNERLIENLIEFAKTKQLNGAWINGLGAASEVGIGCYDLAAKDYYWQKFHDLEILSLQGNIAWAKDEPVIHLHGVFSDQAMTTFGGHVKELTISATCEIYITNFQIDKKIVRTFDDEIGLNLIYV